MANTVTSCHCLLKLCDVTVQANNETEPVNVWYLLTSCTGATSQVLMHSLTYDITPPYLTIIKLTGDTNTTIITTEPSGRIFSLSSSTSFNSQSHAGALPLLAATDRMTLLVTAL